MYAQINVLAFILACVGTCIAFSSWVKKPCTYSFGQEIKGIWNVKLPVPTPLWDVGYKIYYATKAVISYWGDIIRQAFRPSS